VPDGSGALRTLFLHPPSFEGFDGGAGARYQARREIRSFWYPTWLAQPAALVPGSRLVDAPPDGLTVEQVAPLAREYDHVVMHTSTPSFGGDVRVAERLKRENPRLLVGMVGAHVAVTRWMQANPVEARQVVNEGIEKLTGKALSDDVLSMAWSHMRSTWDPIAPSLFESARAARAAGFLPGDANLDGIYDLSILNEALRRNGLAEVALPGSGASP